MLEMKTTKLILLSTLVFGLSACSEEERTINVEHEGQISIKEFEEERKAREQIGSNTNGTTVEELLEKQKKRRAEVAARKAAREEAARKAAAGK